MKALLLTLILILTVAAAADGNWRQVWQPAESAIQDFKDLAKCEARVWPGFSLKGYTIAIIDETRTNQLVIDYESGARSTVKLNDLPSEVRTGHHFFTRNGRAWMSLAKSYNKSNPYPHSIFRLGVHEAFHRVSQNEWTWPAASQGEPLPIRGEPRFYRAMLNLNLKSAFLRPKSRELYLGRARHWYSKWRAEFPSEVRSSTDAQEGSARFAEYIAQGLVTKGCMASEAQLRQVAVEIVSSQVPNLLEGFGTTELDAESYVIAPLAELILRFDSKIPDWQGKLVKGSVSPLEILFENVRAVDEPANADDFQSFLDTAELRQDEANGILGLVRDRMSFRDSYYINIPGEWKAGATTYSVFYYEPRTKIRYSVFYGPEIFQMNGGRLESQEGMVAVQTLTPAPCRKTGWVVPVLSEEVLTENRGFKIDAEQIKGSVPGTLRESNGQRWICIGE